LCDKLTIIIWLKAAQWLQFFFKLSWVWFDCLMLKCLSVRNSKAIWVNQFMLWEEIPYSKSKHCMGANKVLWGGDPKHDCTFNLKTTSQSILILQLSLISRNYDIVWIVTLLLIFLVDWGVGFPGVSGKTAIFSLSNPASLSWADYNCQHPLVIEILLFSSWLSHLPLRALPTVSLSRGSPLCRAKRSCNSLVLMVTKISLWLSTIGYYRVF